MAASGGNNFNNNPVGALPVQVFPCFGVPIAYVQFAAGSLVTAEPLTVPTGAVFAVIEAEAQNVRWRDDGVSPTATIGMLLPAGSSMMYAASLSTIQFIAAAAGAILNISFYG